MISGCTNLSFDIFENKNIDNMFFICRVDLVIDNSIFNEKAFTCVKQCKREYKNLKKKKIYVLKNVIIYLIEVRNL
jgi:hypothetical protein